MFSLKRWCYGFQELFYLYKYIYNYTFKKLMQYIDYYYFVYIDQIMLLGKVFSIIDKLIAGQIYISLPLSFNLSLSLFIRPYGLLAIQLLSFIQRNYIYYIVPPVLNTYNKYLFFIVGYNTSDNRKVQSSSAVRTPNTRTVYGEAFDSQIAYLVSFNCHHRGQLYA